MRKEGLTVRRLWKHTKWYALNFGVRILQSDVVKRKHAVKRFHEQFQLDIGQQRHCL